MKLNKNKINNNNNSLKNYQKMYLNANPFCSLKI